MVHGPSRANVAPTCRFSSTDRDPKSRLPSGTKTIPCLALRSGRSPVTSMPSNSTEPEVGKCKPAIVRSSVDLPAPLAPMIA